MEVCPPIVLLLRCRLGMGQFCLEHRAFAPHFQLLHLLFNLQSTRILGRPTQKLAVEYQSLALTWARAVLVTPLRHNTLGRIRAGATRGTKE